MRYSARTVAHVSQRRSCSDRICDAVITAALCKFHSVLFHVVWFGNLSSLIVFISISARRRACAFYEGEVLVADTSMSCTDAERGALQAVLVKLTGRKNVLVGDVLRDPQTPPAAFIQQFQYRGGSRADGTDPLRFWAKFDSAAIDALLAESGVAVWPRTRPLTAVVLGLDEGGARRVLPADDVSSLIASIKASADARGLPIVLPLMDLRDRVAVGPQDLWGGFEDRIAAAADRYGAEAILYGTVTVAGFAT